MRFPVQKGQEFWYWIILLLHEIEVILLNFLHVFMIKYHIASKKVLHYRCLAGLMDIVLFH